MTNTTLSPRFILVHGNHPEDLRDLLVAWIKKYPLKPLEQEVILVQSNGIAQWLKLALAADPEKNGEGGGCGIAMALEFSLPSRFFWQIYRTVLGKTAVPEFSAFDKPRLIWRLMRLLPTLLNDPLYEPLQRFLKDDKDLNKHFQLAERLTDLFDQYQVYRADWLKKWQEGQDILLDAHYRVRPLTDKQRWQPALWRALVKDVDGEIGKSNLSSSFHTNRARIHESFLKTADEWSMENVPAGLPRRVIVFGISSLPQQSLEVLARVSQWTEVFMCVPNPCRFYWADIIPDKELLRSKNTRHSRRSNCPEIIQEEDLHQHAHPLLAAWGKQGRDFIGLLAEHDTPTAKLAYQPGLAGLGGEAIDLFESADETTLLGQLQNDILDLRPLQESQEQNRQVDPEIDRSIRFHIGHSPQREVEILQDQLLAAFNLDPTLQPRDIIVMVPSIDTYAPLIQAVFGRLDHDDPRYLPFTVADQIQRQTDPLLKALEQVLTLPQSRIGVNDVLGWLDVPAIRQRFQLMEGDLKVLHRWVRSANIRWGLHNEHRVKLLQLPLNSDTHSLTRAQQATQNTWLFGLRRLLVGYALGRDNGSWEDVEPCGEIGGLEAALLGPLIQFIDRVESLWRQLQEPATIEGWCERFRNLLADLFLATESEDGFTLLRLESALQQWQEANQEVALKELLPITIAGPYWLSQLDDGGLSQRFFGGAVTFATLMPMRAIPFRRVYLLGMNDNDYPRSRQPFDFDLMQHDYRPGDRSRREDDRYLFLEALLSAREHLHISWVGRSIIDNSVRAPSVLVGQLRDHLAAIWHLANFQGKESGKELLDKLTIVHRLQPFSLAYFPVQPDSKGWFSYAHEWQPCSPSNIDDQQAKNLIILEQKQPLTLKDLEDFLKNPIKVFFQKRLGVYFEETDPVSEEIEPFTLNNLELWKLQDELIKGQKWVVDNEGTSSSLEHESTKILERIEKQGQLAAGGFAGVMKDDIINPMDNLFREYKKYSEEWPNKLEIKEKFNFLLDNETPIVVDELGDIRLNANKERARIVLESGNLLVEKKSYRLDVILRHWVKHLSYQLISHDHPTTTIILSKQGVVELKPISYEEAKKLFTEIFNAWREGMTSPLPLNIKTGFAFIESMKENNNIKKADSVAREKYEGDSYNESELDRDIYLRRAYPTYASLSAGNKFANLANILLKPVLDAVSAS